MATITSTADKMIGRLIGISMDSAYAPDIRRLATEEHVRLQAAVKSRGRTVESAASYRNVYGAAGGDARRAEDKASSAADYERQLGAAVRSAEHFLREWKL